MGNDEAGFALHQIAHGLLHLLLGIGVYVAGGLVQNQHAGVIEHGPGDGQQLLLPLADVAAIFGDHGVVALGQAHDVVVNPGGLGGGHHLVHGGTFLAVGDVLVDGALEQPGVLKHHGVASAQTVPGDGADFVAVHIAPAAVHVVKTHQQVDDGGFACAGGAHNGDGLPGGGLQGQVLQHNFTRQIAEGNMAHLHISPDVFQHGGIGGVGKLLLLIQHPEHPL